MNPCLTRLLRTSTGCVFVNPYLARPTPHKGPLNDWERMAKFVFHLVNADPALDCVRAARSGRNRVLLNAHEEGIWLATWRAADSGLWELEVGIEGGKWWEPLKRSRGVAIEAALVTGVLERWQDAGMA